MRQRFGIDLYSLTVQLVLSFVILVLLTALAVGLPAILLIRNQIQRQAWELVDHSGRATQALYAAWERNVTHLATLTSHRPTLHALLAQGNETELTQYLQTLRGDAELDLLLICDNAQQLVAVAGATVTSGICTIEEEAGFYNLLAPTSPQVWLLAAHAVSVGPTGETGIQAKVITGVALDEEFVVQSQEQTGLEHTLIADGRPVISSLTGGVSDRGSVTGFPAEAQTTGIGTPMTFQIDGQPYYATTIPINDLAPVHGFDLEDETALANSYLQQVRERVSIDQLQIKTITVFGRSSATIIGHAKRLNVDLIVMSSRGQSSIRRKLYGSASEKVLCGATCATLFIREQEQIHKDDRIRTMEV